MRKVRFYKIIYVLLCILCFWYMRFASRLRALRRSVKRSLG